MPSDFDKLETQLRRVLNNMTDHFDTLDEAVQWVKQEADDWREGLREGESPFDTRAEARGER